ncbi:MAG: aminotransferase class IV [Prolixibacteraceae bacterium]|jgi:branched-subunit amino acid aminotransferase/4-amino-4-deoxychorismate lyase|nr:aminotransferase class IV [Prolixibacteraceae bacterium]
MRTGFSRNNYCDAPLIAVPANSIGLNRGYTAFDFMKVVNGQPFCAERHLARFFRTMSLLRIEIPYSMTEVGTIVKTLAEKNTGNYYGLKFFAVPVDTAGPEAYPADLYVVPVELPAYPDEMFTKGSALITKEYARFLPEAKSTNYLPGIFWENELKKHGAVEILYCFNGQVFEATKSNVFVVVGPQVFTPEKGILKGITRSIVIDILHEKQIGFSEKEISTDELFAADEVFITSTTKGIAPIVKIDGQPIGNGNVGTISRMLIGEYQKLFTDPLGGLNLFMR